MKKHTLRQRLDGISPRMRTVYITLVVCIAIVTAGALMTRRAARADASCTPLWTFNDGSRLWLCPPDIHPVDVAFKPTSKAAATLTYTPAVMATFTPTATDSPTIEPSGTATPFATPTGTALAPDTPTAVVGPSVTPPPPPIPTIGALFTPRPSAPLCLDSGEFHDHSTWHGVWNPVVGCHYDHEHGDDAFTGEALVRFPDLQFLQGGVQVGHVNQSSPMENTAKHGGEKLQVDLNIPCVTFEDSVNCVTDSIVQYHWFGNMAIEMESRIHSVVAYVKACRIADQSQCGTLFVVQFVDLGQRVFQYQGALADYSEAAGCGTTVPSCQPNPEPAYDITKFSYFTGDRVGTCVGCRSSLDFIRSHQANVNGTWTSKGDGAHGIAGSTVVTFLARGRDMYQVKVDADTVYPFTFQYVCSGSDPLVYVATACRYTNSTTRMHEIAGVIPAAWDNLAGFDQDLSAGFITANAYLTSFGQLAPACLPGHGECFPVRMVHFPVGKYGGALPGSKVSNPSPVSNPSRNVWFCGNQPCAETGPGAVPSSWVGAFN